MIIVIVLGLSGAANATLFSPGAEAIIQTNGVSNTASQFSAPHISNLSGWTDRSAGVWTSYGINQAESSVALVRGVTADSAYVGATSKWTDQLTITTPNVALPFLSSCLKNWVELHFMV